MSAQQPRWLKLGKVGKAHGITGAFFVSDRDEPWPSKVKLIRIGTSAESAQAIKVAKSHMQGGRVVLACEGLTIREKSEAMIGQGIWAEADIFQSDRVADVRWEELVGVPVIDESGSRLGTIHSVYDNGRHLNLTVLGEGAQVGATVDVPYIDGYVRVQVPARGKVDVTLVVPVATFAEMWERDEKNKK